jgi:hypothetical protein
MRAYARLAGLVYFSVLLTSCATQDVNRNLAFDTYYPNPNEIQIATTRARAYWEQHRTGLNDRVRYLAVQSAIISSVSIQGLWGKLQQAQGTSMAFTGDFTHGGEPRIFCVSIFDTRTQQMIPGPGYAITDLPPRGQLARFDTYVALYVGTGSHGIF